MGRCEYWQLPSSQTGKQHRKISREEWVKRKKATAQRRVVKQRLFMRERRKDFYRAEIEAFYKEKKRIEKIERNKLLLVSVSRGQKVLVRSKGRWVEAVVRLSRDDYIVVASVVCGNILVTKYAYGIE